jgi:ATP-binding cassette subfamily B protein
LRRRTSIIISHRLSTIKEADRILVLDNGELAEIGTHEELVRRGGVYAELFSQQQLYDELEVIP